MSISPPSDILLDVVNAAGNAAVDQARERLSSIARSGAADAAGFSAVTAATPPAPAADVRQPASAAVKFEGMVLKTFIESMLPDKAESTYGSGLAGGMWKSMLAEKVADVIAERGGVGIANRILGDFVVNGEKIEALTGVSDATKAVERSRGSDFVASKLNQVLGDFLDVGETDADKQT
ncbi:MAG: rod-binding protein [Rhizobiaceae bacterium]